MYTRIHRLLRIMTLVQSQPGWNAKKMATECDVQERTIYRDLEELEAAGIPIVFDDVTQGYRLAGDFFLPPVSLTPEEALALAVLCEHVAKPERIAHTEAAYKALAKIEAAMPTGVREEIAKLCQGVSIHTAPASPSDADTDVYRKVQKAIATRTSLMCRYDSRERAGGASVSESVTGDEFEFEPYALLFSVRAWYAVGHHARHASVRQLKLSRFASVRETGRSYEVPREFSIDAHLGNAWRIMRGSVDHNVEVRFDATVASTMGDTLWHKTQEIEEHDDGSATFRCVVSGLDEIVWWILGYGPHARVVAPAELAERVRAAASATASQYGGA